MVNVLYNYILKYGFGYTTYPKWMFAPGGFFMNQITKKDGHYYYKYFTVTDPTFSGNFFMRLIGGDNNPTKLDVDITKIVYFTTFNMIHRANKLKRERMKLVDHFHRFIRDDIECIPKGKLFYECEARFNSFKLVI